MYFKLINIDHSYLLSRLQILFGSRLAISLKLIQLLVYNYLIMIADILATT